MRTTSHADIDDLEINAALHAFRRAYPTVNATAALDKLREREYARLDAQNYIYLDYTGAGLYAETQLRQHMELLSQDIFGNPHSKNPTSRAMTQLAERTQLCSWIFQRFARRIYGNFYAQRQWRAQARRRVVPVRRRQPLRADIRQS